MVEDEVQDEFASLPDWSGVWMGTGTLFDQSSGETSPNTNRNARDFPPYRPDWEAAYEEFLENVVRVGRCSSRWSALARLSARHVAQHVHALRHTDHRPARNGLGDP